MGIHFVCHHCGYALHVKDFQAGKRGKCPSCNGSFRIPIEDASYSSALEETLESSAVSAVKQAFREINSDNAPKLENDSSGSISIAIEPTPKKSDNGSKGSGKPQTSVGSTDAIVTNRSDQSIASLPAVLQASLDAKWFVRPPSGGQFGPAPSGLLMSWIAQSRVTADSLLCQEGSSQWQTACELLPELFDSIPRKTTETISPISQAVGSEDAPELADLSLPSTVLDPLVIRSGAILKKKMERRKQQTLMVILLAAVSFVLFCILIYVLVFLNRQTGLRADDTHGRGSLLPMSLQKTSAAHGFGHFVEQGQTTAVGAA